MTNICSSFTTPANCNGKLSKLVTFVHSLPQGNYLVCPLPLKGRGKLVNPSPALKQTVRGKLGEKRGGVL